MVTVTDKAQQKLKEKLEKLTTNQDVSFKPIRSLSDPTQLELVLGKEIEGDQVVKDVAGTKLLLIESDLVPAVEGMIVDYIHNPFLDREGFTLSKPES